MSTAATRLLAGGLRERKLDTALGSVGVSAALVSASFAGYMVVVGPVSGSRHTAPPPVAAFPPPPHLSAAPAAGPPADAMLSEGIDFTPTGSIPGLQDALDHKGTAADPASPLGDFAVRDVFDGTALVETHGGLQMVRSGATLAGVGRVLGMERTDGLWTVRTTAGPIRQRR